MTRTADDTRSAILTAAAQEFIDSGYAGATLSAIAGRMGLTKGALTYHFRTKDSIVSALVEHVLGVLQDVDDRASTVFPTRGIETLVAFVTGLGAALIADQVTAAPMMLIVDRAAPKAASESLVDDWSRRMAAFFDNAERQQGYTLQLPPAEAADFLIAAVSGVWLHARLRTSLRAPERRLFLTQQVLVALGIHDADVRVREVMAAIRQQRVSQAATLFTTEPFEPTAGS